MSKLIESFDATGGAHVRIVPDDYFPKKARRERVVGIV